MIMNMCILCRSFIGLVFSGNNHNKVHLYLYCVSLLPNFTKLLLLFVTVSVLVSIVIVYKYF